MPNDRTASAELASYYRRKAAEARRRAECAASFEAKSSLLALAESYDQLAGRLEKVARQNG